MTAFSRLPAWAVVTAAMLTAAANTAHAANPYDGSWYVKTTTARGACDSGFGFGLQVRDGIVSGSGGFGVSGRVTRKGAVRVSLSSGQQSANGSGRLRGNSGGGAWRGVGSQGECTGYWTASRG